MTTTPTASPELPGLDNLETQARAADQDGQHIYTNPRDSNNWRANEIWHYLASPAAVLALIALARRAQPEGLSAALREVTDKLSATAAENLSLNMANIDLRDQVARLTGIRPEGEAPQADYSPTIVDAEGLPSAMRAVIESKGDVKSLTSLYFLIDAWGETQRAHAAAQSQGAPAKRIIGGKPWSKEAEMTEGWLAAQQAAAPGALASFLNVTTAQPRIDYSVVSAYADKHRLHFNGLCAMVREAAAPSAPGTPEAPKLAHGHRDDFYLLANGRRLGLEPISRVRNMPNWVLAMELFATGSGSAYQICRDAGVDPEGITIQRAAQLDGGQEGSESNG